jgi:tetratricopeptide (TPR) repeat protein
VLAAGLAYAAFRPRVPQPPVIRTAGLDPAVAKLIETTLAEVRAAPRSGDAWGKLGSVLVHYEFLEETKMALEIAEALSPREPRWPHLHGLAVSARDAAAATENFRHAVSKGSGKGSVHGIARSREGIVVNEGNRAIPWTDPFVDASRLRLAQALAERGLGADAEAQFQALLQVAPNHSLALLGLARLRHAQGRLAEATNQLAGCLRDPHTARSAHALLAAIEQALGNVPAAASAARVSATLPADVPWPDPWWTDALAYRVGRKAVIEDATVLMDQGRLTEALATLERATRDYPQDEEAWYLLGWAWNQRAKVQSPKSEVQGGANAEDIRLWTQDFGLRAERALREHLRLSPQSPKGHAQLAVALLGQRRHTEAVAVLQAALKLKPTWRELHSNLGFACVQLGRDGEAIGHFRNALALDPNYIPTHTALAQLLERRGDSAEARRLLQQALELDPADARAAAMLRKLEAGR